jgi:sulfite oxidase
VDSSANVQPEKVEDIWNLRGILNTSWHRIKIQNSLWVGRSKM